MRTSLRSLVDTVLKNMPSNPSVIILRDARSSGRMLSRLMSSGPLRDADVVQVDSGAGALAEALRLRPHRVDLIVDLAIGSTRAALFDAGFWALRDGGAYLSAGRAGRWIRSLRARRLPMDDGPVSRRRQRQEFIDSSSEPARHGCAVVIEKRREHHFITRHSDIESVLSAREPGTWGRPLARNAAYEFASRAAVVMHGEPSAGKKPDTICVPELSVREYHNATCHPREIVTKGDLILPDTFRHWQDSALFHKRIQSASPLYGRLVGEAAGTTERHEDGAFYSLDSAFPHHYGHLMTETLSRFWGWEHARTAHPGLRPVITHQPGKAALPPWKADILTALGIATEEILWVEPGESISVDVLVTAMPQLVNPRYVDRRIQDTWDTISDSIAPIDDGGPRQEKIFLTRRGRSQRACSNTPEVEQFFVDLGFDVVVPEKLTFREQVHLVQQARVVAGFGGSALFTTMFNRAATMIVLTSRSYVAANEYLIASVNGNEIHYFWAPPAIDQPDRGFSRDAYQSGFEFPLHEHAAALRSACR